MPARFPLSLSKVAKRSVGLSIFVVDLREAIGNGMTVRPIANMANHETKELFFSRPSDIPALFPIGAVSARICPDRHSTKGGGFQPSADVRGRRQEKWCQKRTRILLYFVWYNSHIDDVVFAKARRKARISMWLRGSSPIQGLETYKNGGFPPFPHREQKQKIGRFRDRKARKNSFLQRSNLPRTISHDPHQREVFAVC